MSVIFKDIDPNDLAPIYAVEQAAQNHPMSLSVMQSCFSKRYFNTQLIINDEVAGFYIGECVLDESSLIEICVSPKYQGQGLGRQLLTHYIDTAKGKGAMSCWLEVRESNVGARKLYQALDFNEVDIRPNYYPTEQGHEDAIIMSFFLF